jgi:hypothetical protein
MSELDTFSNLTHTFTAVYGQVQTCVDIRPGAEPNFVNPKARGVLPVAVLSSKTFDATTLNPGTITLGGVPVKAAPNGRPMASIADVNSDGLADVMLHFDLRAFSFARGEWSLELNGWTTTGVPVTGSDTVVCR